MLFSGLRPHKHQLPSCLTLVHTWTASCLLDSDSTVSALYFLSPRPIKETGHFRDNQEFEEGTPKMRPAFRPLFPPAQPPLNIRVQQA
jgi:hypothetical protein